MQCVVTGGCGFIGSNLVERLVKLGHRVLVLDDLSAGSDTRLNPAAELIVGSVNDMNAVLAATRSADWIFHTAALPRIQRSIDDPIGTHDVNVTGTLNVLCAAQRNGVGRVINSSSSSVYGDQPTHLMREDMTPNPKSPYALQKLMGEKYADIFARLHQITVVSLRYFNVYGPGQPADGAYALVIPRFLQMKAEAQPLTIYGDGSQTRSYTHVDDVVEANILAATGSLSPASHTVLNVGTDVETSVNEIAAIIGGPVRHIVPNPRSGLRGVAEGCRLFESKVADRLGAAGAILRWYPILAAIAADVQFCGTLDVRGKMRHCREPAPNSAITLAS